MDWDCGSCLLLEALSLAPLSVPPGFPLLVSTRELSLLESFALLRIACRLKGGEYGFGTAKGTGAFGLSSSEPAFDREDEDWARFKTSVIRSFLRKPGELVNWSVSEALRDETGVLVTEKKKKINEC